ncbi:MAG: opacity protein-like surface antigen [Salibacteraceae bacterium]|jgi:opacity protein-like surface antigen
MKNTFIILTFILSFKSSGQNHEISLNYRIGLATNQNQITNPDFSNHLEYKQADTRFDQGVTLDYGYKVWKKLNLFVSGGIEVSESKNYFRITDGPGGYHLANVEMNTGRFAYRIGLNKQFSFFENKMILDIGCHIVDRFYFSDSKLYSQPATTSHLDWIDYEYELETKHGEYFLNPNGIQNKMYMFLNLDYSLGLKLKVSKNMFMNLGLNYARNNISFYNFNYVVTHYDGGSSIPTSIYTNEGIEDIAKYGIRDHFIYLNMGLSYKFNYK